MNRSLFALTLGLLVGTALSIVASARDWRSGFARGHHDDPWQPASTRAVLQELKLWLMWRYSTVPRDTMQR
jgi:hypothetical protein